MGNTNHQTHGMFKKFPLKCDSCVIADSCPKRTPGSECLFEQEQVVFSISEVNQCIEALNRLLERNWRALERGTRFEAAQGGIIDDATTKMADRVLRNLELLAHFFERRDSKHAEQPGPVFAPTVQVNVENQVQQITVTTLKELLDGCDDRATVVRTLREALTRPRAGARPS